MGLLYDGEDILAQIPEDYYDELGIEPLIEVRDWTETGLELTWEEGGVRDQPDQPNLLTFHWTGGEGTARTVHNTLKNRETRDKRGLSVQLYVDYEGIVWQYCDLDTICRHASSVNGRSIGIEIQNRAFKYKDAKVEKRMDEKFPRGSFQWTMLGRKVSILSYSAAQIETIKTLSHILCDAFEIPKCIPGDRQKVNAATEGQDNGFYLTDQLPPHAWTTFQGVCGHFHVHRKGTKLDPGPQVFEALWDANFELVYEDEL
jgi:hypothetical protein